MTDSWGDGWNGNSFVIEGVSFTLDAINDDGSSGQAVFCMPMAPGCTDPIAENYDTAATTDDGSCEYINGCMDLAACNFDSAATADDGSCEYLSCACDGTVVTVDGGTFQTEVSWTIADCDGNIVVEGGAPYEELSLIHI